MSIVAGGIVALGTRYWWSIEHHVEIGVGLIALGSLGLALAYPFQRRR